MTVELDMNETQAKTHFNRILSASFVLGAALFSTSSLACSIAAWDTSAGGVTDADTGLPRYVEECGFLPTAAGQYVQDNITGGVTTYEASLYVFLGFATGSTVANTVTVFEASDSAVSAASTVRIIARGDGTAVLEVGGSTSSPVTLTGGTFFNGWAFLRLSWASGGTASLAANGGSAVSVSAGAATLEQARVGFISGPSANLDSLAFDRFESYQENAPGIAGLELACPGDVGVGTEPDLIISSLDAFQIYAEANGGAMVDMGQPDFNGDGVISSLDAFQVLAAANNGGVGTISCDALLGI